MAANTCTVDLKIKVDRSEIDSICFIDCLTPDCSMNNDCRCNIKNIVIKNGKCNFFTQRLR